LQCKRLLKVETLPGEKAPRIRRTHKRKYRHRYLQINTEINIEKEMPGSCTLLMFFVIEFPKKYIPASL
jgi:hypothetical protein